MAAGIVRLSGIHSLLHLSAHVVDCAGHPGFQLVYNQEVLDFAAGGATFPISVLEDVLVSLYVSWPNDLFPVIRRIPPQFTLWIGLNSTDESKAARMIRDSIGREDIRHVREKLREGVHLQYGIHVARASVDAARREVL